MPRRLVPLVLATAATFTSVATPPANALNANIYVMTGAGTISPGLTLIPTPQSMSFTGTATYVSTLGGLFQTTSCSVTGTDLAGSIAEGVGTLSGACGPASYTNMVFVRVFDYVTATAAAVGGTSSSAHWDCVFQPDQINPTTSYKLTCLVDVDFQVP